MDSINYTLNEEQKMMQEQARKFAMAEIRPAELALDKIPDSEETFKSDIYKEIKKRVYQMGYHKLRVPEKFGGLGLGSLSTQIVTEELAVGGVGLAHSILPLGVTAMVVCMLGNMPGAQELIERFVLPFTNDTEGKISGCIAFTEPDYGSDLLTGSGTITTTARKDGGDWIINGAKAQWISNGTSATDIMAIVKIASGDNAGNSAIFVIPSDTKGVSKGKPADKIGERAKNQTEIFFDDVRVPERYKIDIGFDGLFKENFLCMGNTNVGTCMLGLVRAAYEDALEYAKVRIQGGKPIIEHQVMAMKLMDAYRIIEGSRALLWKSGWMIDKMTEQGSVVRGDLRIAAGARSFICNQGMRVISEMAQIFGGYGLTKEYPVEKYLRDAKALAIADGTCEVVSLLAAEHLGEPNKLL